jgi:hypothetical protein
MGSRRLCPLKFGRTRRGDCVLRRLWDSVGLTAAVRFGAGESACRFVSSRGILRSCDAHARRPRSSQGRIPPDLGRILRTARVVHLCTDMVPQFVREHLPRRSTPFTLVTGDSDLAVVAGPIAERVLDALTSHPMLVAWYAQNRVLKHPKLHSMPIGLDCHTLSPLEGGGRTHPWGPRRVPVEQERQLVQIGRSAGSIAAKEPRAFCNWHFAIERGDRRECRRRVDPSAVSYQSDFTTRDASWRMNTRFAFTMSPAGAGLDCHRTWEALLLGSIPVVLRSPLDELFTQLPVVIVDDWSEVTPARLRSELDRIARSAFDFSQLELSYWTARIQSQPSREGLLLRYDDFLSALPE